WARPPALRCLAKPSIVPRGRVLMPGTETRPERTDQHPNRSDGPEGPPLELQRSRRMIAVSPRLEEVVSLLSARRALGLTVRAPFMLGPRRRVRWSVPGKDAGSGRIE